MTTLSDEFDQIIGGAQDGDEVGFSVILPAAPAVTEKYIYLSLAKTWGDLRVRIKADDLSMGTSFGVPTGQELMVAFMRPGKEKVDEALREGAITVEELMDVLNTIAALHRVGKGEGF